MNRGTLDVACPLDWSHPANRGVIHEWAAPPSSGWRGGSVFRDMVRGARKAQDATLTNSPTWAGGRDGLGSIDVADGSTSWLNPGTIDVTGSDKVALGAMLYCRSTQASSPNIRNIAGCDTGGAPGASVLLRLGDGGAPTTVQWIVYVGGENKLTASVALPLNRWVFVLGVYDGTNQYLYYDGLQVGSRSQSGNVDGGNTGFAIGQTASATRGFDGRFQNVILTRTAVPNAQALTDQIRRGNPDRWRWISSRSWFVPTGTASITGDAAITQAGQTLSAAGTVLVTGSSSPTQAAETLNATGAVAVVGASAVAQAAETLAATGAVAIVGASAVTQAAETLNGVGAVAVVGAAAITQAAETLVSAGINGASGDADITQAAESLSAAGVVTVTGSAGITQAGQTLAASGIAPITGSASITQAGQSCTGVGGVAIVAALAKQQADNTLAATGTNGTFDPDWHLYVNGRAWDELRVSGRARKSLNVAGKLP